MWQQSYSEIVFKLNVSKRCLQEIDGLDIAIIKKSYDSNTLFARLYNDIEQTSISIFSNTMNFIRAITTLLTFFIFLTTIHWLLALLIFFVSLFIQPVSMLTKKYVERSEKRFSDSNEEFSSKMQRTLRNYKTLYFANRTDLLRRFTHVSSKKQIEDLGRLNFTKSISSWLPESITTILTFFITFLMVISMLYKTFGEILTPGLYTVVLSIFSTFSRQLSLLLRSIINMRALRMVTNKFAVNRPKDTDELMRIESFKSLKLSNVTFKHGDKTVFEGLNLEFKAGKRYAIIGPSGSGKTTLVNLLLGIEAEYQGDILINDINYRSISSKSLYPLMAYSPVITHIFNVTVWENVTLWSKGNLDRALTDVNLLQEPAGDSSAALTLSEGQKQRLGIARSLFLEKPILIFDEAFANIDAKNTHFIKERLSSLAGRTIITVSHHIKKDDTFFDEIIDLEELLLK